MALKFQRWTAVLIGRPGRPAIRRAAEAACGLYAGSLLVIWAMVRWSPPGFWPADLFLYGPRWASALPLLPLAFATARLRLRRQALELALASVALPVICGFNMPLSGSFDRGEERASGLRVLTCNVQSEDLEELVLSDFIRRTRPDVVMLQESTPIDIIEVLGGEGWNIRREGEFCLASRYPILGFEALRRPDKAYRVIAVRATVSRPEGAVRVVAVHLMTPRAGLDALIRSPLGGLGAFREVSALQDYESGLVREWIKDRPDPILIAGDFNLTEAHSLYRRDWAGYANAFAETRWGLGHTMFTRHLGLRIDHVLAGPKLKPGRLLIGPEVGSAHRPLVAEFE